MTKYGQTLGIPFDQIRSEDDNHLLLVAITPKQGQQPKVIGS